MSLPTLAVLIGLAPGASRAATGGPDAFGYTYADQADGAVYNYIDISATGVIVVDGDDRAAGVALGAPFGVYGVNSTWMVANTNGFLTNDLGSAGDLSNDCPLPANRSTGDGFRVNALHEDIETTVYYQYFDAVAAAAVGYPGQTDGISVFQWVGTHSLGVGAVDVEAILFHDTNNILTMVAADTEGGSSSTFGMQDANATTGLTVACNTPGTSLPGVTAILYTAPIAPADSDCCSASASGLPGCYVPFCEETVCATNPACCSTSWDAACVAAAAAACPTVCNPQDIRINEIRLDDPAGNEEYFELVGPPGATLDGMSYVVVGDIPTGEIEEVVDLSGHVIPPSGYFLVADTTTFSFPVTPDMTDALNFEDSDTNTHFLVAGLPAIVGNSDNLDAGADGILDFAPWAVTFDTVAIVDPLDTELPYGPGGSCLAGPLCQEIDDGIDTPMHVYRCSDTTGFFSIGQDDLVGGNDSPGVTNPCCGDGVVDPGEDCDTGGVETVVCDSDCTAAVCGDGLINATAGELCDDGGESATCNADCTPAGCGDGVVNMAAGEACDDAGESATCNADCTTAVCGDLVVNMTAGEECDEGGAPTAACDSDCTFASCGDGVVNVMAGETCDDMGRSATCNADCTAVSCGDGIVNMTAGEECDGDGMGNGGETETCDTDCTNAVCGDMYVNKSVEECDDGAATAACDDDCTLPECGDGVLNEAAGEECDDGNNQDLDGCAADCTIEMSGTTGGMGDTGTTGGMGDSSGGGNVDDTGGVTITAGGDTTSGGSDESGSDDGNVAGDDGGCSCTTGDDDQRGGAWAMFALLLGLGGLRRRRRHG